MGKQIHSFPRNRAEGKTDGLKITTKEAFMWTIITLRKFANLLDKIIISWERFETGEIQYFYDPQTGELADTSWGTYISAIYKDVNHLRDLLGSLKDQTKLFEDMTTNVCWTPEFEGFHLTFFSLSCTPSMRRLVLHQNRASLFKL